ncbi:MAG: hypothetical protein ACPGYT_06840 [Nitrospirales bacterium]
MKLLKTLGTVLTIAALSTSPGYAANECKAKYGYGQNKTSTVHMNAGQTKTVNKNNVAWVQNKKAREIKIKVTKMVPKFPFGFKASGTKWVALSNNGNIDPPTAPHAPYPSGVKLYKISCKPNSSSSGGTSPTQSGRIIVGSEGAITTLPSIPKIRPLQPAEIAIAKSVYGNSINLNMVKVTNTIGFGSRAWTTNTPPFYTVNVGVAAFENFTGTWAGLLVHELGHVWQGQHGIPFMSNSAVHQTLSVIQNGGSPGGAYKYVSGKQWNTYNSEQQASIITDWFRKGKLQSDKRYPYIRDNVRPGLPNATTHFPKFNTRQHRQSKKSSTQQKRSRSRR